MAGNRSLIEALLASLCLHAALLVVPIEHGHHFFRLASRMLEATLIAPTVSLPEGDSRPVSSVSRDPSTHDGLEAEDADTVPETPPGGSASLSMPLPQAPMPIYFTARELNRRPFPIGTVLQEEAGRIYPDSVTRLRLLISERGQVDHAEILETTNPSFAREALQAFAKARYAPGALAGKRVKSELRVEVTASNAIGMVIRHED
ncbi:MAG: energy transducer TonB [Sulfuritalea sp.]